MSAADQQIARLRRDIELLKQNQVVIYDTEPRVPTRQSIWRDETGVKWWDGKNWQNSGAAGNILNFSSSVVFSSSGRFNVTWSAGVLNLGTETGTGVHSIDPGAFTMTTNTFIYWAPDMPNAFQTTTTPETAVTEGGIIVAVGIPNSDTSGTSAAIKVFGNSQNDLITADQIVANTITANKLSSQLIYAGSLVIDTNGKVRGGQTDYATGTGFFLGYSGAAYKFSIGSSSKYFRYDGTDVYMNGANISTGLTGQRVEISGSNIRIYNASNQLRLQSNGTGFRFTDSTLAYNVDIDGGNYSVLPAMKVAGAIRADALAGNLGALNIFLHTGQLSFKDVSNSLSGTVLSSPNDDTLLVQGTTITLNGKNLYSDGTDLFWNGVKIN